MKTKGIIICLLLGVIYMACEDTIGRVGLSIQPDEDKVSVFDTILRIDAQTIEVDSIYAKTNYGLLGDFYDLSYGNIKSSYICEYYPSIGFLYLDSIVDNKIDSVQLNIYYTSFLGDPVAPMEVSVYPVIKPLDKNYYTNANPEDYCDMNNPIAKYGFTPRNLNISDSLLGAAGTYWISIPLPVKLGQDYLEKVQNDELRTLEDFLEFLPGTYITTTFGTGSMLAVNMTDILVYYTHKTTLTGEDGSDSIVTQVSSTAFTATKEIIQLNKIENKNPAFLSEDSPDKMYIKSPAGVFTELTIPIKDIVKGIGKKKFSNVSLSLKAYPPDEWTYSLPLPGISSTSFSDGSGGSTAKLLLIEPDSVVNFFEMRQVADKYTSYVTQFESSTYTYDFKNISNVVQNAIEKAPDKDLKLWLIPVQTTWYTYTYNYSTYQIDYMTSYDLSPSGVTLKKGGDNLKVNVVAADLKINN